MTNIFPQSPPDEKEQRRRLAEEILRRFGNDTLFKAAFVFYCTRHGYLQQLKEGRP